jgi:hypothetical protein
MTTYKPSFDLINVMPSFLIGKNELITSAKEYLIGGTDRIALRPILGNKADQALPGNSVHVNDVAKIQVMALDPKIQGNQNFMISSQGPEGTVWDDAIEIAKRNFPDAVEKGLLKLGGTQPSKRLLLDSSRTEEVFGFKLAEYEEQVKSVLGHYLEIAK